MLTLSVFPQQIPSPQVTPDIYLRQAAADIVDILKSTQQNIPKLTYGNETKNAFIHVAQILKRAIPPAKPINTTKPTSNPNTSPIKNCTKEPRVDPIVTPAPSTASTKNDTKEPRVNLVFTPTKNNILQSCTTSKIRHVIAMTWQNISSPLSSTTKYTTNMIYI